jgi:hypothetical protein
MTRGMQGFWSYYNFPLHKSSGNNLQHTMDTPTSVEKLALDRLAAATSASAIACQTVSSNLRTIETLIQSDATKPEAVIVAKFTESIHMLAAYRNIFSDILTPGDQSVLFDIISYNNTLRWTQNTLNVQCGDLKKAVQKAFRQCLRAKVVSCEQRRTMELAMLHSGMAMETTHSRSCMGRLRELFRWPVGSRLSWVCSLIYQTISSVNP